MIKNLNHATLTIFGHYKKKQGYVMIGQHLGDQDQELLLSSQVNAEGKTWPICHKSLHCQLIGKFIAVIKLPHKQCQCATGVLDAIKCNGDKIEWY